MKRIVYITLIAMSLVLGSCDVQERIVFNEDMGGSFESIIDLSTMLTMAKANAPANAESKNQDIDTLIVFNEILETYKDSIATLPQEEKDKIEALKDMSMKMRVNEDDGEMKIVIAKNFKEFKDLERVSYDMEKAFESAKNTTEDGAKASNSPAGSLLTMDKVIYTFTDNTFRRTDPSSLSEYIDEDTVLSEKTLLEQEKAKNEEPVVEDDNMFTAMFDQMTEELSASKMKLEYVFPRKVVSVSPEGAVISEDRKTVYFEVDWKTLMEDKNKILENFEVVLEDE